MIQKYDLNEELAKCIKILDEIDIKLKAWKIAKEEEIITLKNKIYYYKNIK